jgi:hypothetical protein
MTKALLATVLACLLLDSSVSAAGQSTPITRNRVYDVLVYGGTSAGIMAAVEAKRLGKQVLLISPEAHLGGLTANGLGWIDAGKINTVGGLCREFFHRVWQHYQLDNAWKWEARSAFPWQAQGGSAIDARTETMWVLEPSVARGIFERFVDENHIPVVYGKLDLNRGVYKRGTKIVGLRTTTGRVFSASTFIDASYEGDLMRGAGVSYTVGREANSQYAETIDGSQLQLATKNQLPKGISAYRTPGDPTSGLLPGVEPEPMEPDGTADDRIQSYCYRLCLTNVADNRVPISKPIGYQESDYEILFRAIQAGQTHEFMTLSHVPNSKTDVNNSGGISTDFIGQNYRYPLADYAERSKIADAHRQWQLGLIWTLQICLRVPQAIRDSYSDWGLAKDEFTDNENWPNELYIREAVRMIGGKVVTESALRDRQPTVHSVGMGSYTMDSHNVRRLVRADGTLMNEGDVQVPTGHAYGIPYESLLPKESQCTNLIVPVCMSATHIAYGSIRMEPVFMILGQSAGAAAVLSQEFLEPVQQVDYEKLLKQLTKDGQVLEL